MKGWAMVAIVAGLAASASAEIRHTVVDHDTMWDLASHYYSDNFKWRRISEANPPPKVHDPHWIYPGQILMIPDLEGPAEETAPAEPAAEPEPEPQAPPPPPVEFHADKDKTAEVLPAEALSRDIPEGLVAQPPSNYRFKVAPKWKPDGTVEGLGGNEVMAAEGDLIDLKLDAKSKAGERFTVYRAAGPSELDDPKASYVVKIGLVSIKRPMGGKTYRAEVLKSNDALQIGDLVQRGE